MRLCLQGLIDGKPGAERFHFRFHLVFNGAIAVFAMGGKPIYNFNNPIGNLPKLSLFEAAGCCCGRSQTDT